MESTAQGSPRGSSHGSGHTATRSRGHQYTNPPQVPARVSNRIYGMLSFKNQWHVTLVNTFY